MQAFVQIPDGNAPRLSLADFGVEDCRGEIELRRPLEAEPTLPDVAVVLGRIVGDGHRFYCICNLLAWRRIITAPIQARVELRGNPLFARKKRRMGHPLFVGGSRFQKLRVGHLPQPLSDLSDPIADVCSDSLDVFRIQLPTVHDDVSRFLECIYYLFSPIQVDNMNLEKHPILRLAHNRY